MLLTCAQFRTKQNKELLRFAYQQQQNKFKKDGTNCKNAKTHSSVANIYKGVRPSMKQSEIAAATVWRKRLVSFMFRSRNMKDQTFWCLKLRQCEQ